MEINGIGPSLRKLWNMICQLKLMAAATMFFSKLLNLAWLQLTCQQKMLTGMNDNWPKVQTKPVYPDYIFNTLKGMHV